MRCLSNIQSMHEPSRKWFTQNKDSQILPDIVKLLISSKSVENSTLFPVLRVVFFASAVDQTLASQYLEAGMLDNLAEILENLEEGTLGSDRSYDGIIKTEILNISFNITVGIQKSQFQKIMEISADERMNQKFSRMLKSLISLGIKSPVSLPGITPPHGQIINVLLNIPFDPFVDMWFPNNSIEYLDKLLLLFESLIQHLVPVGKEPMGETVFNSSIDELVIPITLVLTKMAGYPLSQERMKSRLMPMELERTKPLTELNSITGALVRAMSSIRLHQIKDIICDLLVKILSNDCNIF